LTLYFTNFDFILTYTFSAFATGNNSALGVEVNPEAYSYTLCFEILKYLVV